MFFTRLKTKKATGRQPVAFLFVAEKPGSGFYFSGAIGAGTGMIVGSVAGVGPVPGC